MFIFVKEDEWEWYKFCKWWFYKFFWEEQSGTMIQEKHDLLVDTCKLWMNPRQQVIAILPQIIKLSFVFPFGTAVGALWFPFSAVAVAWTLAILNPVWFYHGFNFTKKHSTTSLCHFRARKGNKLTLEILRSCSDIMRWSSANLTWPQLKQIDGPVLTESEFVLTGVCSNGQTREQTTEESHSTDLACNVAEARNTGALWGKYFANKQSKYLRNTWWME